PTTTLTAPIAVSVCCTQNWAPSISAVVKSIDSTYTKANASTTGPGMYWTFDPPVSGANGYTTTCYLYNSRLKAPYDFATLKGLHASTSLYGQEYIPSPMEDMTVTAPGGEFATDVLTA